MTRAARVFAGAGLFVLLVVAHIILISTQAKTGTYSYRSTTTNGALGFALSASYAALRIGRPEKASR